MSYNLKDIITMTELRTHLAEVLNEIQGNQGKKLITVNGKPAVQIQDAVLTEGVEQENISLKEENEVLKTLLGLKTGLEAYQEKRYLEHDEAMKICEHFYPE